MANTFVNESFVDIYNTIDQSEVKETDSKTDNYDTCERNSRDEDYRTLDLGKSQQEVANERNNLISRSKATCAFRVILTVVVIATLIAVAISFTIFTKKDKEGEGWSLWEEWGSCSVSCGVGTKTRNRTCTNSVPHGSEVNCPGPKFESIICSYGSCTNPCQSHPCHYGNCRSNGDDFKCLCFAGYSGLYCENDIYECASNPCLHGTCTDLVDEYNCTCFAGYSGRDCQTVLSDCVDILRYNGSSPDGIYTVRTWKIHQAIKVYCDMTTDGGGWTVFQNRFDGSIDFYRNFSEYEGGFGNLTTEFWLGLSNIRELASHGQTSLRIDLEAANGTKAYETFESFYLSSGPAYTLHLGPTSGSSGISSRYPMLYHNGKPFSTYDHDADSRTGSCAISYRGAWWYGNCYNTNLNGLYLIPGTKDKRSMNYSSFLNQISLKRSKMMMRRA